MALLAALVSMARWGRAETPDALRVVVVAHSLRDAEGEFVAKVRAELGVAGFEVLTVVEPDAVRPALEQIAARTNSVAALRFVRSGNTVAADAWTAGRAGGQSFFGHVRPEPDSPDAPSIIAIRSVELLRATMLEGADARGADAPTTSIQESPAPPAGSAKEANQPAPAQDFSPDLRWSVAAGGGVIALPRGLPVAFTPALTFAFRPRPSWALELSALGPATGVVEASVGSAHFDAESATLRVALDVLSGRRTLVPRIFCGAGVLHFGARGEAREPFVAASGSTWVAMALLGAGARARLTQLLSVVGEAGVFVVSSQPVVRFAGQDAATSGRPGMVGTLSLQVAW